MRALPLLIAIALLATAGSLRAQSYSLRLHRLDGVDSTLTELIYLPNSFAEQATAFSYVRRVISRLQDAGYLAASADSVSTLPNGYDVYIFLGEKWRWARLSLAGVPLPILAGTGITDAEFADQPLSPHAFSRLTERLLRWCENNGYPLARVSLDSVVTERDGGVNAQLTVETGALRRIDSIIIDGDVRISKAYLMRYLEIHEGGLYNESHVRRISARLHDLPFLQEGAARRITFRATDTKIYLTLKERRANQFNAIMGLQANGPADSSLITAEAQVAVRNLLGSGESFSFSYQKLQAASPRIRAEAIYPYLPGTPLGIDGHFDLYFKGTEYRRTVFDIGCRYAISAQDFLRVYYRGYYSRIITPNTSYIRTYHRLPDDVDVTSGGGGMEVQAMSTDYRVNPSRGWAVRVSGEALRREVLKNDIVTGVRDVSGFNFKRMYDTLNKQPHQYQLSGDAAGYIPLMKRFVLKGVYAGGWISGERLFRNELFQLGGLRLLRGFDEGSIFANQYHILTGELRYMLTRASSVYIFSDNAWIQSNINGFTNDGLYYSVGLGTFFETKAGQFSLAYGVGHSPSIPIELRRSKIHIGYVAYF